MAWANGYWDVALHSVAIIIQLEHLKCDELVPKPLACDGLVGYGPALCHPDHGYLFWLLAAELSKVQSGLCTLQAPQPGCLRPQLASRAHLCTHISVVKRKLVSYSKLRMVNFVSDAHQQSLCSRSSLRTVEYRFQLVAPDLTRF
jgi:hypothetical protein